MSGCYALGEVAPDRFKDGEYFSGFFTKYGLKDEINLLFAIDSQQTLAISFGRSLGSRPFGVRALSFLTGVSPFLRKLVEHSMIDEPESTQLDRGVRALVHARLKNTLASAGSTLLSRREKQVLDYLLRGFSAKATAKHLNVTQGTIRLHRHNLYAKLKVTSHSELFALVLGALVDFNSKGEDDPLASLVASRDDSA